MSRITKLLLIFPLLYVYSTVGWAQKSIVPGYQGKRMLVGIGIEAISANRVRNKNGEFNPFSLNSRMHITAGYAISRKLTGILSFGTAKAGHIQSTDYINLSNLKKYNSDGLYNFRYNYASVGFQTKVDWGMAPIGPFWGIKYLRVSHNDLQLIKAVKDGGGFSSIEECNCILASKIEQIDATPAMESFTNEPSKLNNLLLTLGARKILKNNFYYEVSSSINPFKLFTDSYRLETPKKHLEKLFVFNLRLEVGMLF